MKTTKYQQSWSGIVTLLTISAKGIFTREELEALDDIKNIRELVDKETPCKPTVEVIKDTTWILHTKFCPGCVVNRCKCGSLVSKTAARCHECGQLLDRSKDNE